MRADADGSPPVLGRAAAATGTACVVAHVATAAGGGHGGGLRTAVLLVMAGACLPCVRALWRRPDVRVWRVTGWMYGGMLFVHLLLITAAQGTSGHAAHAGADRTWAEVGMWSGLALAAVQVALAGTALAVGRVRQQQFVGQGSGLPTGFTEVAHPRPAR